MHLRPRRRSIGFALAALSWITPVAARAEDGDVQGPPRHAVVPVRAWNEVRPSGANHLLLVAPLADARALCELPCVVDVPDGARLRLAIGERADDVDLAGKGGSSVDVVARHEVNGGRVAGGVLLTIAGAGGLAFGGVLVAFAGFGGQRPEAGYYAATAGALTGGLVLLASGIWLLASPSRTVVRVNASR